MLTATERHTIAFGYLQAAQALVAKIRNPKIQEVMNFLEKSCRLIVPGLNHDFHPGLSLSPKFDNQYLVWVYVFDHDDLAYLPPHCPENLGLHDEKQMAAYFGINHFLVLNSKPYSAFMKGLWKLHEGFHAWSHQVLGHTGKEGREQHEHEAHEFDQMVLSEYGGSAYQTLLEYRVEEIRQELGGRSLLQRQGFREPSYLHVFDQMWGRFQEPSEEEIRKRLVHRHAVYTLVWEMDLSHESKVKLLNSLL